MILISETTAEIALLALRECCHSLQSFLANLEKIGRSHPPIHVALEGAKAAMAELEGESLEPQHFAEGDIAGYRLGTCEAYYGAAGVTVNGIPHPLNSRSALRLALVVRAAEAAHRTLP